MIWKEDYVKKATKENRIVAGFNIFGIEDAIGILRAAQQRSAPVILMINKDAAKVMSLESWVGMLKPLAMDCSIPVAIHLDHCTNPEYVKQAIHAGFTSVMYDGSQLTLEENVANSRLVAEEAKKCNVLLEGEIGSVPYADIPGRAKDIYTTQEDLTYFAQHSDVDWIAVAIGQIHRMQTQTSEINFPQLESLQQCTDKALVVHGGSGIPQEHISKMRGTTVGKINIGTGLRVKFFQSLQEQLRNNPDNYDRGVLFAEPTNAIEYAAHAYLQLLGY